MLLVISGMTVAPFARVEDEPPGCYHTPSGRYLTQHSSIFDLCCADDTLFGASLLSESWDAWGGVEEVRGES